MSTTYIISNNMAHATHEAKERGIDIESLDTIFIRSVRQIEGRRIVGGDKVVELGVGLIFDWLHERERIHAALERTVMMSSARLVTDPDDPRLIHVVPIKKES